MAKIYKGNFPSKINVIVNKKVYKTVRFDENGIFETEDTKIIEELKNFGYKVEEVVEENHEEVEEVVENKAKVKNKKGKQDEI